MPPDNVASCLEWLQRPSRACMDSAFDSKLDTMLSHIAVTSSIMNKCHLTLSVCYMLPWNRRAHLRLISLWYILCECQFKLFSLFVLKISKTLFPHLKPVVCSTGGAGQPDVGRRQHCVGSAPGHHETRLLSRPRHLPHPETPQDEQVRVWRHAAGRAPVGFLARHSCKETEG